MLAFYEDANKRKGGGSYARYIINVTRDFCQQLNEDESRLVSDAETALGAQLDEATTIHVTPVAGTIVAYATVVGVNGDSAFLAGVP